MPSLSQRVTGFSRLHERLSAGAAAHGLVLGRLALGLLHARAAALASAATSAAPATSALVFLRTS